MTKPKAPLKPKRGAPRAQVRKAANRPPNAKVKKCAKILAQHRYEVDKDWQEYDKKKMKYESDQRKAAKKGTPATPPPAPSLPSVPKKAKKKKKKKAKNKKKKKAQPDQSIFDD